jgi:hypothetical protein
MDRVVIREGMSAFSADGKRLGRVVVRVDAGWAVEGGLFFKEDYAIEIEDVARIEGDEVHLALEDDEIESDREYERIGPRPPGGNPGPEGVVLSAAEESPALHARDPYRRR